MASRRDGQGHEYFDFAAPAGYQIDALTVQIAFDGIAEFGFSLPEPAGWPPQYSFSKRFEHFKVAGTGGHERRVVPPPGTEFLSVGTSWGPWLYSNTPAEIERRTLSKSEDGPDLKRWSISFSISPKNAATSASIPGTLMRPSPAAQALIDRYAAGWSHGYVINDQERFAYSGLPRLDVYAEDWLVYAIADDIRIVRRRDPRQEVRLPATINSREREFNASLVRTHDGRYGLLWARGTSATNASRFVAFSADLIRWETPQRLIFEAPPSGLRYTYAQSEPLERTTNIVPVARGYAMLLAQGFLRLSDDLRNWGPPRKVLRQELSRNRLLKGPDGIIWAAYETSSDERQLYTEEDRFHGYYVIDGTRYRHVTELRISRSHDGIAWDEAGKVVVPGQPSAIWAFPVSERQIGIAAGFNNLFVKWFATSDRGTLVPTDAELQLFNQSEEAEFFLQDGSLTCIRPIFDFARQRDVLLATITEQLWSNGQKP